MWLLGRLVGFVFRKIRLGYIISSRRPSIPERPNLFFYGCGAGMIGLAAMTVSEILEQLLTGHPVPSIPGARARLCGDRRRTANTSMRYGNRVLVAILRAWMSYRGVRGLLGDFVFVSAWVLVDQTWETRTRVIPWASPVNERIVIILHKTVFALVTGYFTDRWIQ